ncbi:MAG: TetR/AcrR family transcriptional regulator [bacterium]|nr:TetR/AcrR family transcriptional regulator [bacterium]
MSKTALDKAREAPRSTKARILAAAEEVFAARGFAGASTREIAARAGVNISSLHYHWASKETLYLAVFRNVFDHITELLGRAVQGVHDAQLDRHGAVERVMSDLFDYFADHPNVTRLLVRRIVEDQEADGGLERDVLQPAWAMFDAWLARFGKASQPGESRLFMLSLQSVVLVYLLDSQAYRSLLGGSVREAPLREQVRAHVLHLVHTLLGA